MGDRSPAKRPRTLLIPASQRHPLRAMPCVRHGDRTRKCAVCGHVVCWKCAGEASAPLLLEDICPNCTVARDLQSGALAVIDKNKAAAALKKGALFALKAKGNRSSTCNKKANVIERWRRWGLEECGLLFFDHEMIPELVLMYGIDVRMQGSSTVLCPEGAVLASTISKELTAMSEWRLDYEQHFKRVLLDSVHTISIIRAMKFAKDNCKLRDSSRITLSLAMAREGIAILAASPLESDRQIATGLHVVTYAFTRPGATAAIWFDPHYVHEPESARQAMSAAEVMARPDRILFFNDAKGDGSARLLPTPGTEKNALLGPAVTVNPELARGVTTTRFLTNAHFGGGAPVSELFAMIKSLGYTTAGPLLRRDGRYGLHAWTSDQWTAAYRRFEEVMGLPDKSVASAEFRRAHAQAMREYGIPEEYIRMVGFWWSEAARIYQGAAQAPRLDVQKSTGRKWSLGPSLPALADLSLVDLVRALREELLHPSAAAEQKAAAPPRRCPW